MDEGHCIQFKPEAKPVYEALAQHQVTEDSWEFRELLAWLQLWAARFIAEFSLNITEISLCVNHLSRWRLGHYRYGFNGFGLAGEIAFNRRYLDPNQPGKILGTLLHELIHAWQEAHGRPGRHNYHNVEFRDKAREYGLIIDQRGHTQYEPDSRFFELLVRYGVELPQLPSANDATHGVSKLKKWSCQCTPPVNARVAIADFRAFCLRCGATFTRND